MKILYVARLFSGLVSSVEQKNWQPAGVPTIYKMAEALDTQHEACFMLLPKGGFVQKQSTAIKLPPLHSDFYVLPSEHFATRWLGRRCRYALREVIQFFYVLGMLRRFKPDILYIDHANVLTAALVARFNPALRVVFRLMGCYGVRTSFSGNNPLLRLFRWGYRSPFAAVICTQEGSNVDYWLTRALAANVPRHVMLNGVDPAKNALPDARLSVLPRNKTIVLSIGRLDPDKAVDRFLQGFLSAWRRDKQQLHALIIGTGTLKSAMLEQIKQAGAEHAVTFIENLAHEQIALAHRFADIYVSLNRAGNLSNANLEAMQAGQCMILPKSQPETGIDVVIDELLSDQAVCRVSSVDSVQEIADAIYRLHSDPQRRAEMSKQLTEEAGEFLHSWDERVKKEMAILESLLN